MADNSVLKRSRSVHSRITNNTRPHLFVIPATKRGALGLVGVCTFPSPPLSVAFIHIGDAYLTVEHCAARVQRCVKPTAEYLVNKSRPEAAHVIIRA